MAYEIIQPPFTLRFREMSEKELKEYNAWFHRVTPERVAALEAEVRKGPGLSAWTADRSPGSFDTLGPWFASQVETRPRTPEEKDAILSTTPWVTVPDKELTNRTFSIAYDVGIYFGLGVLAARPSAKWEQPLDNKKFADYGQPVVGGLGPVPLNPIRIAVTFAYGIAGGQRQGSALRQLFDTWVSMGQKR
jgi:hypothetical protein